MSTKAIRASGTHSSCDVCGRTLLRGERSSVYIDSGARKDVCELCEPRALHEGWTREGTVAAVGSTTGGAERRPSLFSRLRSRRRAPQRTDGPTLADDLDGSSWSARAPSLPREPRHVRAVPTSVEQRVASAIELFNGSEHPRTVAGVARSLGPPTVAVVESPVRASQVSVIVSWELCWYRYEVDLSDDEPSVRVAGQGYELAELAPDELHPVASADEHGSLQQLAVE